SVVIHIFLYIVLAKIICMLLDHISFFFQAEDGIRDFHVTGVQTCALPICPSIVNERVVGSITLLATVAFVLMTLLFSSGNTTSRIGRASCRERVKLSDFYDSLNIKLIIYYDTMHSL